MYRFIFGAYGFNLYIEQLAHREMVGRGRTFLTVDQEACVVSGMTDIIQSHIVYDTGGLAGMIITDPEMIRSAVRNTGGVGCQAECVTGIGFRYLCTDADVRVVDQPRQPLHDLTVGIALVNIELEFIVHIVDRNIKGISIRSQCGSQIREKISKILLGSGKGAYLQIEFRRSSGRGFGTDIGDLSDIVIGGIGTFFTEHAVLLQPAELCDGVVKLSGVLLDIHSIILSILTGGRKIPGCILVQFYDGIIDTAKFTLFMCVVFRQLSG